MSLRWYAVHVHSNAERTVEGRLSAAGIEAFAPFYKDVVRWSDRTKVTERPLFAGYLFARLDIEQPQQRVVVVSTAHVLRILSCGQDPIPVPDADIEAVRQMIAGGAVVPEAYQPGLHRGDHVVVKWGPLVGVEGTVLFSKGEARIIVAFPLLGRAVASTVDRDSLQFVPSPTGVTRAA